MKQNNNPWISHPDKYFPPADNLIFIMEWFVELKKLIRKKEDELNEELFKADHDSLIVLNTSQEIEMLWAREIEFFMSVDYKTVLLIKTAMLIGHDLWKQKHDDYAGFSEEAYKTDIRDLEAWKKKLSAYINPNGQNQYFIMENVISKRYEFIQEYLEKIKALSFES